MYISHDVVYRIFSVELVSTDAASADMELFKEISQRLFKNKVITTINIDNVETYTANGNQLSRFDIHLCNTHDPSAVRLTNVEKALQGLFDNHENYSDMQIRLN